MAQPSVNLVPFDFGNIRHNERPALRTDSEPARSPDTLLHWRHSREDVCRHLFYLFAFFHSDRPYADSAFTSLLVHESYLPVQDTDLWAHTNSPRCRRAHGGNVRLCRDFNRIHLPVPSPAPSLHGGVRTDVAAARSHRWVTLIGYRTKHVVFIFIGDCLRNSILFQTKLDFCVFDMHRSSTVNILPRRSRLVIHALRRSRRNWQTIGSLSMCFRIALAHISRRRAWGTAAGLSFSSRVSSGWIEGREQPWLLFLTPIVLKHQRNHGDLT